MWIEVSISGSIHLYLEEVSESSIFEAAKVLIEDHLADIEHPSRCQIDVKLQQEEISHV